MPLSGVREAQFVKEDLGNVIAQINSRLSSTVANFGIIRDQVFPLKKANTTETRADVDGYR